MVKGMALLGVGVLVSAVGCGSSNSGALGDGKNTGGHAGGSEPMASGAGGSVGTRPPGGAPSPSGTAGANGGGGVGGTGGGAMCAGDPLTRCGGAMNGVWCTEMLSAGSNPFFTSLWANRPDDVWFVGGQFVPGPELTSFGMYAHFDGCTWTVTQRPDLPQLAGVWGAASNDVWLVGQNGSAYHWDGSTLTAVPVPGATSLNSVSGSSSRDVWAVGTGIFHWDGSAWAQSSADVGDDVWAVAPNDVWVASGTTDARHFDGTTWTSTPLTDFGLFSIWGDGAQAYAGGEGEALFHFEGGSWTTLQGRGGSSQGFTDIGGLGADVFTVGNDKVVRLSGNTFTEVTDAPLNFYGTVWVSPTQVWLGASGGTVTRRAR